MRHPMRMRSLFKEGNSSTMTVDLFAGTAQYYARFRLGYPESFIKLMLSHFDLPEQGRLLDLGCGTGQLALLLHSHFRETLALDINEEMIAEGQRFAEVQGISGIRWLCASAEAINEEYGRFELVVCGSAFHWMDQEKVAGIVFDRLVPGGGFAIVGQGSFWTGSEAWQQEVVRVVQRWLGESRRAGEGVYRGPVKRHEDIINESKFGKCTKGQYYYDVSWNPDFILGYLYSTSFCSRRLLGDNIPAFEADLRAALYRLNPEGQFRHHVAINYILAQKPEQS